MTTLLQFLQEFLPTYNTCQLFILAVKQNEKFMNVLTSIQFSYQSDIHNLSDWSSIVESFHKADDVAFFYRPLKLKNVYKLLARPIRVRYSPTQWIHYESFNSLELNVYSRIGSGKLDSKWRKFRAFKSSVDMQELWRTLEEHKGLVIRHGYRDIRDFRRKVFGTDNENMYFLIDLPMYACIEKLTPKEITVYKQHLIKDLQINLRLQRANYTYNDYTYNDIDSTQITPNNSGTKRQEFLTTTSPFKFKQENKYRDRIEASLINTEVPELCLDENSILVPFERATESFSQTVFEFYPLEDFKEHLFTPEQFRKPEDVFQDAVATLLSLVGYSIIILGKKQYIKDTGEKTKNYETLHLATGYLIGSADILAYRENDLLLIDCTIGSPEEKKIQKLHELIDHLGSLSSDVHLNITSIIVTPRDSFYDDEEKVRIVDGFVLDDILDAILMNDVETARRKLMELRRRSPVSY